MSKQREERVDEDTEAEESAEGSQTQQAPDDEPEVNVGEHEGKTTVEVSTETRKQRRDREFAERTAKLIDERQKPLMDTLAAIQAAISQPRQAPIQQQVPVQQAPVQNEFRKIRERQEQLVNLMSRANAADLEGYRKEYYDLDEQAVDLKASQRAREMHEQWQQAHPPQDPPEIAMLRTEFSDVLSAGPAVANYAKGLFLQQQAKAMAERKPFNEIAAHRAALTQAAEDMNVRPRKAAPPSDAERGRFVGFGKTSTGGGATPKARALTREESAMAVAWAGPGVSKKEAETKWAKMVGPDYFKE